MRILHVISGLDWGGGELFCERLLRALDPVRFTQCVVSLRGVGEVGERLRTYGFRVTALNARDVTLPISLWRLRGIIRAEEPDIVQGWLYNGNVAASLARILAGAHLPLIWNIRHSLDAWQMEPRGTRLAIRLGGILGRTPTRMVFNSERAVRQHEHYGYRSDKALVIPNGIDVARFHPDERARAGMRAHLGLNESETVIGALGRFHVLKNQTGFLRAARRMLGRRPNLRFVLTGAGVTYDNQCLAQLIRELGLSERVLLLGQVDATAELLNAMDIFVSPSLAEGFPNAVGEAMACGLPCVVTDAGASAELVGDSGIVVPRDAPEALANGILQMIHAGAEHRRALGAAARERIRLNYSMERIAEQYAVLYRSVCKRTW